MNRLLFGLLVGAVIVALGMTQLWPSSVEVPPEPAFPAVIRNVENGWPDTPWSVGRDVDDPFDSSRVLGGPDTTSTTTTTTTLPPEPTTTVSDG